MIYKHIDGYYGLPGGSIEKDESFEETLKREVKEEITCEILDYELIGYVKDIQIELPKKEKYQLRYWVKVKLLSGSVNDPCGKALSREVINLNKAAEKLNWGERGRALLQLAIGKYKKYYKK